ncbi:HAD family phosphatase [Candidatus Woesearchaeota archaeon]|nr:HAD family phosphatase [Candidatus Woesearchaeota archaeon]
MKKKKVAAFFDLDHTIIRYNSGIKWGIAMALGGKLPLKFMATVSVLGPLYIARIVRYEPLMTILVKRLKGVDAKKHLKDVHDYFDPLLKKKSVYPDMEKLIKWHKSKGHKVFMITQSLDFLADMFKKRLWIDDVYSTKVEIVDGKFTGKVNVCASYRKDYYVKMLAKEYNIDLGESYAYSDSAKDVPMFKDVGHPVAVNPSPRLKQIAEKKKWVMLSLK